MTLTTSADGLKAVVFAPRRLSVLQGIVERPFAVITYTQAVERLQNAPVHFEYPVQWGLDLQSEHERYLTEQEFSGTPLFVTDYPKEIKVVSKNLHLPDKGTLQMPLQATAALEILR